MDTGGEGERGMSWEIRIDICTTMGKVASGNVHCSDLSAL